MGLHRVALAAWVAVLLAGCTRAEIEAQINTILGSDYDLTVSRETSEIEFDVGAQVTRLEDRIATDKDSSDTSKATYAVLKALCETEPGKNCEPARFPARIPSFVWPFGCFVTENGVKVPKEAALCTMPLTCEPTPIDQLQGTIDPMNLPMGNGCIDVAEWMADIPGIEDLTKVAKAFRYDLSDKISLKDSRQVKKVAVNSIIFRFKENSVTYAIPQMVAFVGDSVSTSEAEDAKGLIAANRVLEFGTLAETAAMFTGDKSMSINDTGRTKLSDKLKEFAATVAAQFEFVIPPPTEAARADNCKDPAHLPNGADFCESFPKPDGKAKFTLDMTVTFTINPKGQ